MATQQIFQQYAELIIKAKQIKDEMDMIKPLLQAKEFKSETVEINGEEKKLTKSVRRKFRIKEDIDMEQLLKSLQEKDPSKVITKVEIDKKALEKEHKYHELFEMYEEYAFGVK